MTPWGADSGSGSPAMHPAAGRAALTRAWATWYTARPLSATGSSAPPPPSSSARLSSEYPCALRLEPRPGTGGLTGSGRAQLNCAVDVAMESILDLLRLLGYEGRFCPTRKPRWPLLTPTYFVLPSATKNQNEQFHYFVSLAFWLLGEGGLQVQAPSQYDDPNQTCTQLLQHCRAFGFEPPEFPVSKLRQGYGEPVCAVLHALVESVMEKQGFTLAPPVYPKESAVAEEVQDTPPDEQDDADFPLQADDDEYVEDGGSEEKIPDQQGVMTTQINPAVWKVELERLAPKLKLTIAEGKEWRSHLAKTQQHLATVTAIHPDCKAKLDSFGKSLAGAIDKIKSREGFINDHFDPFTHEYHQARDELEKVQERCNTGHSRVAELSNELSAISKELDSVRRAKEGHESSISDTSPLVKVKSAISQIQSELVSMRVRIGVVEHAIHRTPVRI